MSLRRAKFFAICRLYSSKLQDALVKFSVLIIGDRFVRPVRPKLNMLRFTVVPRNTSVLDSQTDPLPNKQPKTLSSYDPTPKSNYLDQ